MRRVVVVGHGMVGSRFAELLVEADPRGAGDGARQGAGRRLQPRAAVERRRRAARAPACSGSPARGTPGSRSCTGVGGRRRSTGTARVVVDDRGREHAYDELVLATGSAARVPPIQGVAYDEGLVEGVFVLKDMADATGIVEAAGQRPAGGRPRRRGARRRGRDRPGDAGPAACGSSTSPTASWSASSAGRRRRWRSPAWSGSASRPTSGPRSSVSGRAAGGSRASASPTASRPRPTCSSCAAAPSPRRCSPAGPASPSTGASSSPTTS